MPYKELREEWSFSRAVSGNTGLRILVPDADGEIASLPVLGSAFPMEYIYDAGWFDSSGADVQCTLRRIVKSPRGVEEEEFQYRLEYADERASSGGISHRAPPDDTVAMEANGEFVSLEFDKHEATHGWKYENGLNPLEGDKISMLTVTASFSISETHDTFNEAISGLSGSIGKINSGEPDPGCWLFLGFRVEQTYNADGDTTFTIYRNYKYLRIIDPADSGQAPKGWQWIFNKQTGLWDRPYKNVNGSPVYLYSSTSLPDESKLPDGF